MAVDWGVFIDWVVVTAVITLVVGLSHSFFKAGGKRTQTSAQIQSWKGEFVQVVVQDSDTMLLFGQDALRRGDLEQCAKTAYSAAEEILAKAADTLGVPPDHTTLADMGRRLTEGGFVGLNIGELELIDAAVSGALASTDIAKATRALSAAFSVRNYFMHAPVARAADKKPIGYEAPSDSQA